MRKSTRRQSRSYGTINASINQEERRKKYKALRDRLFLTKYENSLAKSKNEVLQEKNDALMKENTSLQAELEKIRTELKRARTQIKEEALQKDKRQQKMLEIVDFVDEKCETGNNDIYEKIVEPRSGLPFTEINFLEVQEALVRFLIK